MSNYNEIRQVLIKLYEDLPRYSNEKIKEMYYSYLYQVRKRAYRNIGIAQYDLAQHYDSMGILGDPNPFYNPKKMFYWYKKSADNEYIYAYNNLADLYERGEGCEKNIYEALETYKLGMIAGDLLAKKNYKLLKSQL